MRKNCSILLTIISLFCGLILDAQSGTKWATGGNSVSAGEFFGSTNNQSVVLKVNNTPHSILNTNGTFKVYGLAGAFNRLLFADVNGVVTALAPGNSNEILNGNMQWVNANTLFSNMWQANGNNIYYSTGTVGIGTTNPNSAYKLDVIGDARISNDLYVGGGVVITSKVNASEEVTTRTVTADSIKMDATRGIFGETNVFGDARLKQQLSVTGNTDMTGNLNLNGKFYLSGNQLALDYVNNGNQKTFSFGTGPVTLSTNCTTPAPNVPANYQFNGTMQIYGTTAPPSSLMNVMDIGFDGASHFIEGAGFNGTNSKTPLLVNYYCGNDIYLNTGSTPGFVGTGPYLEVGMPTHDLNIGVNIKASDKAGLVLTSSSTTGSPLFGAVVNVDHNDSKGLAVYNNAGNSYESFSVKGDGTTRIGQQTHFGKLNVDGTIMAKEIKVTLTGWADYVFDKSYWLMPLNEVEKYIRVNKHLPGIPSAAEMLESGNNLAETDKLFMMKIEELTLYNIELKNEQEENKKEMEELKKEIEELKALLKN